MYVMITCKHNYIPIIRKIEIRNRVYEKVYASTNSARDNITLSQEEIYCMCTKCWDSKAIAKFEKNNQSDIE